MGIKVHDDAGLPPFMPPSWDPDAFRASVDKLRRLDYRSLCLAHFGLIYGEEAQTMLDEVVMTCETWWRLFEENAARLDDVDHLFEAIMREVEPAIPELLVLSSKLKLMLAMATGWSKLVRKKPPIVGEVLLKQTIGMLVTGYRIYEGLQ